MPENPDVEKSYSRSEVISKLRRLADCLEEGRNFEIQIAGNRITMPPDADIEFEYQREGALEEIEIELKWQKS